MASTKFQKLPQNQNNFSQERKYRTMKFRTTDYHYDHTGKLVEGSTAPIRARMRPIAKDFYTVDNKWMKKNYLRWYSIGRFFLILHR